MPEPINAMMNFGQTLGSGIPGRENDRDGKLREVFLSDGMTVKLESKDPYGFWFITWGRGKTPDSISGAFTSAEQAHRALTLYLSNEKYDTRVVDKPVEKAPPLQTKPVAKKAA